MLRFYPTAVVLAATMLTALPAGATFLDRQGEDQLVANNALIVRGTVVESHSYWDANHTFMQTDVTVRPFDLIKGKKTGDITFTLPGGTVDDITVLYVGSPQLTPGNEYVLFLNEEDFGLGGEKRLTVRDYAQGVFEVVNGKAISQARDHPLVPDALGRGDPVGGELGINVADFARQIRDIASGQK